MERFAPLPFSFFPCAFRDNPWNTSKWQEFPGESDGFPEFLGKSRKKRNSTSTEVSVFEFYHFRSKFLLPRGFLFRFHFLYVSATSSKAREKVTRNFYRYYMLCTNYLLPTL